MRRKYFKNDMTTVRLRWGDILMPLLKKYKLNITWGDQDLLNIIFFHNPESLFVFPCQWNYRPDHCIYGSNCQEAEEEGIFILHGNRGVYHDDKQPAFRAIYEALRNCSFEDDNIRSLLKPLELELQKTVHTYCGKIYKVFIKQLAKSLRDRFHRPPKERWFLVTAESNEWKQRRIRGCLWRNSLGWSVQEGIIHLQNNGFFLKKLNEQYIHVMKNNLMSWTPTRRHFWSVMCCNVICYHSSIDENIVEWL